MLDHKLQKCMFKVNMFLFTLLYPNKYWQLFIRKYFSMYLLLQLIDYLAAFDGLLSENKRKEVSRLNRRCIVVMGRTPFYRTSNELEHHFSNIERTRTCSCIGDRTRTLYFWLRTNEHRTSNLIGLH